MTKVFAWDNGKGPWGAPRGNKSSQKAGGGRQTGGPSQPQPELEDLVRYAQDRMRGFGGGNGGGKGRLIMLALAGLGLLWLLSGFYVVATDQQGVVLRFGQYVETTQPGLNYHLPAPIETVLKPQVTRENIVEIGFRSNRFAGSSLFSNGARTSNNVNIQDISAESLMLTGDENIVDLDFTIRWRIADPRDYLFNVVDVPETIKNVGESVMREVIGRHPIDDSLTNNKTQIQQEAMELLQEVMNRYRAGVQITSVELQQVNPPVAVIDAFRDVQAARADAERAVNEAIGYSNDILPKARGQVAQIMQEAEAFKASRVAEASGAAQRFEAQLSEYRKAKEITQKRLYLQTMQKILSRTNNVVMTGQGGQNVLPYLPLNQMQKGGK